MISDERSESTNVSETLSTGMGGGFLALANASIKTQLDELATTSAQTSGVSGDPGTIGFTQSLRPRHRRKAEEHPNRQPPGQSRALHAPARRTAPEYDGPDQGSPTAEAAARAMDRPPTERPSVRLSELGRQGLHPMIRTSAAAPDIATLPVVTCEW